MQKQHCFDFQRSARRGWPEAIYCEGKTEAQIAQIAHDIARHPTVEGAQAGGRPQRYLFTRCDEARFRAVRSQLADARWYEEAALAVWPPEIPESSGGKVLVCCAGTSDLPRAREAELTAQYLGCQTQLIADIGVAGLHRVLDAQPQLRSAAAIIAVAGMEGALPAVVSALVGVPVIALPTSIGYGANFGGLSALLSMLNSCSPGIGVVNIDNGYGAGYLAAQIARPQNLHRQDPSSQTQD